MSQIVATVLDVLNELRIDLQDFAWLIAQQLGIDSLVVNASDQVYLIFYHVSIGTFTFIAHYSVQVVIIFRGGVAGSSRSFVRRVASRVPLKPVPRFHFTIGNDYASTFTDWDGQSTVDTGLASLPVLDRDSKIDFWK